MSGVDEQDEQAERDDLADYIAEQAKSDPGFSQAVADALERRRAQRRTAGRAGAAASAPRRDLTRIGMHATDREPRERYHRNNGTQRKRGR